MAMEKKSKSSIIESSKDLPQNVRDKIITMLMSGEFPVNAQIARACNVRVKVITELLDKDPELVQLRKDAEQEMAQLIEKSAIELATNGRNELARQKSQEFLLKKMMPEKYGDDANLSKSASSSKRIIFAPVLPVVPVDENGIPIANSQSPLKQEAIDVRSE